MSFEIRCVCYFFQKLDETTVELANFLTMKFILGLNQKLTDFTKLSIDREMRNMFLRCFIALTHVYCIT